MEVRKVRRWREKRKKKKRRQKVGKEGSGIIDDKLKRVRWRQRRARGVEKAAWYQEPE